MPITRTETIPLREGEALFTTEERNGEIVVTITTRDAHPSQDRQAGREFLKFTKQMKEEHPIDLKALEADPDPRLRAILDGFPE